MKKLFLVDVSSLFFRAFYAIPPLTNKKGLPTNALYGFLSMSLKMLKDIKPEYVAFCFDRKEPSFRHEIYKEYKAQRSEIPERLIPQIPYVRQLSELLGIRCYDKMGFEADDIIAALAHFGVQNKLEVVIMSSDKDFAQLVGPQVKMYDSMKDIYYDENGVFDKWGIRPEQMVDYLSLVGDSSDNVPGVKGIGPKGAQKLLADYKTLEGIYENIDLITAKALKAKLITDKENAFLSRQLVVLPKEIEIPLELKELEVKPLETKELIPLLEELEFHNVIKNITNQYAPQKSTAPKVEMAKPAVFNSSGQMDMLLEPESAATKGPRKKGEMESVEWTVDEFKKNIEPYTDIWAILPADEKVFFVNNKKIIYCKEDLKGLGPVLGDKFLNWKGFDLKEIWHKIQMTKAVTPACDLMISAYILKSGAAEEFSRIYQTYTTEAFPVEASPRDYYQAMVQLEKVFNERIKAIHSEKILNDVELPTVAVLYEMEKKGVLLNPSLLKEQSEELAKDIKELETDIHKDAGVEFNIASPKQLGNILFEKLKLPAVKKTKTGFSTDSDVLEKLAKEHVICSKILEYREYAKLKSTYVDALPELMNAETHRIHTNFRQAHTTTGRLSSINPNLQNIPIRTLRGRAIRKAFVAPNGYSLISADYSQIELRVLAHITQDPGLIQAFNNDLDIHAATASEIYGIPLKDVTSDLRRTAKAVNFGIAYGQGAFGLAEGLGIGRKEAQEIIARYFNKFKNVRDYMEQTIAEAKEKGYVESVFGRRRYVEEIKSQNAAVQKFGERAAINAPMQATSSDIVKMAMIKLDQEISIPMLLQVHDELLFECPDDELDYQTAEIKKIMESTTQLSIPLKVNISTAKSWEH